MCDYNASTMQQVNVCVYACVHACVCVRAHMACACV